MSRKYIGPQNKRGVGNHGTPELAYLIRSRREHLGLSQAQLAERIERSRRFITGIESGDMPLTHPETAENMAAALGIRTDLIYMSQSYVPQDLMEQIIDLVAQDLPRLRWAVAKLHRGELFDEEMEPVADIADMLPGDILIPRKRTKREEREWQLLQEAERLVEQAMLGADADPPSSEGNPSSRSQEESPG